jgi:hypothetical protein
MDGWLGEWMGGWMDGWMDGLERKERTWINSETHLILDSCKGHL